MITLDVLFHSVHIQAFRAFQGEQRCKLMAGRMSANYPSFFEVPREGAHPVVAVAAKGSPLVGRSRIEAQGLASNSLPLVRVWLTKRFLGLFGKKSLGTRVGRSSDYQW